MTDKPTTLTCICGATLTVPGARRLYWIMDAMDRGWLPASAGPTKMVCSEGCAIRYRQTLSPAQQRVKR